MVGGFREAFTYDRLLSAEFKKKDRFGLTAIRLYLASHQYSAVVTYRMYQLIYHRRVGYLERFHGVGKLSPVRYIYAFLTQMYYLLYIFFDRVLYTVFTFSVWAGGDIGRGFWCTTSNLAIASGVVMGENVRVRGNVTIAEVKRGSPIIGNNVHIGIGAVIIGKVEIGDNAIIGAGSVVYRDVPADCTVMGNPAKIVYRGAPK